MHLKLTSKHAHPTDAKSTKTPNKKPTTPTQKKHTTAPTAPNTQTTYVNHPTPPFFNQNQQLTHFMAGFDPTIIENRKRKPNQIGPK